MARSEARVNGAIWLGEPVVVVTATRTTITQDVTHGLWRGWEQICVELEADGVRISDRGEMGVGIPAHLIPLVVEAIARHTPDPATVAGLLEQQARENRRADAVRAIVAHIADGDIYAAMAEHTGRWVAAVAADLGVDFDRAWVQLHDEAEAEGANERRRRASYTRVSERV